MGTAQENRQERLNLLLQIVDSGQYTPSVSVLKGRLKQLDSALQQVRCEQKVFGRVISPNAVDTICDTIICEVMALHRNGELDKLGKMETREPYVCKGHLMQRFAERLFSDEEGERAEYYKACMDILDTEPSIYLTRRTGGEVLNEQV